MKTITQDKFQDIVNLVGDCPISVSSVKESQPTHSWDTALETINDDIAPYGVYIINKVLQSIVGSAVNELTRFENNRLWLTNNPQALEDAVQKRHDWNSESLNKVEQLFYLFSMLKMFQNDMFEEVGINSVAMKDLDDDSWKPQEFVPFEYDEEEVIAKAKARKLSTEAIEKRVELDKAIHDNIVKRMPQIQEQYPTDEQFFKYGCKLLEVASSYYDRCITKRNEHFAVGKDGLSEDSGIRAEYLANACNGIAKILNGASDVVPEDNIR